MPEKSRRKLPVGNALVVAIIILLPLTIQNPYYLGNFVVIGLYTIIVTGLGLLMGYAGQVSLGHAAFYGLGAYTSGILSSRFGMSPWLTLAAAGAFTGLVAYVIGIPTLKLKEHFLALATLAAGLIISIIFMEQGDLTGGPSGLTSIPGLSAFGVSLNSEIHYYYLVWAVALLITLITRNLIHSRIGRALEAIHGSETAAACAGVPTDKYKLQVFVLSAVYAGLAGGLYAHYVTFISPSPFNFQASVEFVLMAVVGGFSGIWGPLLGVMITVLLTEGLRAVVPIIIPSAGGEFEIIFFGIILVVMMLLMPRGLSHGLINGYQYLARRGRPVPEEVDLEGRPAGEERIDLGTPV